VFATVSPNTVFQNHVANTVFNTVILRSKLLLRDEKVRYECATRKTRQPKS